MDIPLIIQAANVSENDEEELEELFPNYMEEDPGMAIPYLVILCLAIFLGTVGNSLVIGAVLLTKKLKTVGNTFIVNLAIADLCVTAFVDPFSVIGIILGESWFVSRPVICEAVASICLTSCFCSLLSIGAVSFNRYIHICHNKVYSKVFTRRNSLLMCVGLWIVSFLAEMSCFIGWGDHSYDRKTLSCVWDRTADFSYTLFFSVAGVAFPVTLIFICYVRIYLFVKASKIRVSSVQDAAAEGGNKLQDSMKLARTLFIIFAVFAVCWSPYAVIVVIDRYDTFPMELHIFSILIAHTNSSLNFMLYGLTNSNFRAGYKNVLWKIFKKLPKSCTRRWKTTENCSKASKISPSVSGIRPQTHRETEMTFE